MKISLILLIIVFMAAGAAGAAENNWEQKVERYCTYLRQAIDVLKTQMDHLSSQQYYYSLHEECTQKEMPKKCLELCKLTRGKNCNRKCNPDLIDNRILWTPLCRDEVRIKILNQEDVFREKIAAKEELLRFLESK